MQEHVDTVTHSEHSGDVDRSPGVLAVALRLSDGSHAWVSPEDFPRLSQIAWCKKLDKGYVHGRYKKSAGGHGGIVELHRFILSAPDGMVVDHIDGNPLNNTRTNLQLTTHSRNAMRSPLKRGGVTRVHNSRRWRARLRVDGKLLSLGCYDSKMEARAAVERTRRAVWTDPTINVLQTVL